MKFALKDFCEVCAQIPAGRTGIENRGERNSGNNPDLGIGNRASRNQELRFMGFPFLCVEGMEQNLIPHDPHSGKCSRKFALAQIPIPRAHFQLQFPIFSNSPFIESNAQVVVRGVFFVMKANVQDASSAQISVLSVSKGAQAKNILPLHAVRLFLNIAYKCSILNCFCI